MVKKYRASMSIVLLALILAVIIHHVRVMVFAEDVRRVIFSDMLLLEGKPQWRLFQSRVLGPILTKMLMRASPTPDIGNILFDLAGFGAALVLAWLVGSRVVMSRAGATAAMLTMTLGYLALFARDWFFSWDVIGPAFFMGFAWLVITNAKPIWIAALFAGAIWNREDALFIGLFLIIQPPIDWWLARRGGAPSPLGWRSITLGLICVAGGMLLITILRRLLLVHEVGPEWFGARQPTFTLFFQWNVPRNLNFVREDISWTVLEMPAFVLLPPLLIIVSCLYLACISVRRFLGYALINLAMVLATLMFGHTPETRQWSDSLPAVVLAASFMLARVDRATEAL